MTDAANGETDSGALSRPVPRIVVGLGNPGPRYSGSRHNFGSEWVEQLAGQIGTSLAPSKRFKGLWAEGDLSGQPLSLFIPDCWMNESGPPVAHCLRKIGCSPSQLLVVHDEIDLPIGTVRFKFGGSDAGHNGLRDLRRHLGTGNYGRLRLGAGRPDSAAAGRDHVLSKPPPDEREAATQAAARALRGFEELCTSGWEKAMQLLHSTQSKPPPDAP